jgi:chromosome partitioning protein
VEHHVGVLEQGSTWNRLESLATRRALTYPAEHSSTLVRPGGNLLKKGRGLRKRTKGGPEEAETPAEYDEAPVGGSDPGASGASIGPAVESEPAPPPPAAMAAVSAEAPSLAATEPEPDPEPVAEPADMAGSEPSATSEAEEPLVAVEDPEPVAAAPAPAEPEFAEPEPAEPEVADAGESAAPDLVDDEPPLAPPRAAPVPEGPVLETAKLPEVAAEPNGMRPLTLPRVIAIANQKGGVGKTTTTVNLGAALAEVGFRVLVLDLDPQGNASTGLGLNPRDVEGSVYDVLLNDVALEDIVEPTSLKNLFVAPATIDLAGAEIELVPVMSRELKLKKAIDQVRDQYDLVLIDCPPSLGLLTVNGLAASDDVIVPIQCEYYALEGLGQLLRNVGLVQANLNPALDIRGIILTMYDARTKLADQVVSEVRAYFGEKVYETVVPRTVRLSEAPSFGQPIIVFDTTSRGAKAYRDLAQEVSRGATGRAG